MNIDLVTLGFDKETEENLFSYCKINHLGIATRENQDALTIADFKFHVTVMYSLTHNPLFLEGEKLCEPFLCKPIEFDFFGPERNLLVLKLAESADLLTLHAEYIKLYEHKSAYDPFRPHLTIKGAGLECKDRISEIRLPDFDIRATKITHRIKVK